MDNSVELDSINRSIQRLSDKMDSLMTRAEYEARQATLENRVTKIEVDMRTLGEWGGKEHVQIRKETEEKFDKILEKFDNMRDSLANQGNETWKWGVGLLITFLTGGGVVGIAQALHILH